jgi:hypothetical protein
VNYGRKLVQMLHACGVERLPARLMVSPARENVRQAIDYLRSELDRIEYSLLPPDVDPSQKQEADDEH